MTSLNPARHRTIRTAERALRQEGMFLKRFSAFDPPEYLNWKPDPLIQQQFTATITATPRRRKILSRLSVEQKLRLYEGMVRFRLHDITLKRWVRQGVISKAWLGTGEEAVTVGCVHALRTGDLVGPMIRNAGACHEMGMPLADLFRAYLGTADQITRGRDLHTGSTARGVVPPISFVASLVPVMAGMALAARYRGEERVALTWVGDGASRTAEFHEGFNFAAVKKLPLVVVLQDNGVALGTPRRVHTHGTDEGLGQAYGVKTYPADGNHVLDVYAAASQAVTDCRTGAGPALILARTFRMGGHATHDEAEARALFPGETFASWGRRDPISTYEDYLARLPQTLDSSTSVPAAQIREHNLHILSSVETRVAAEVETAAETALESRRHCMPDPATLSDEATSLPESGSVLSFFPPLPEQVTQEDGTGATSTPPGDADASV